jgi:hypothetical protein
LPTQPAKAKLSKELVIYCDESDETGKHFSNFYGGVVVESKHHDEVVHRLAKRKVKLNLLAEVKWQKITENYADKYISLIDEIFDLIHEDKLKLRIMFSQNYFSSRVSPADQRQYTFLKLYYQFIKHGFGLSFCGDTDVATRVRLYFDKLPDTREKCEAFKGFLLGLNSNPQFQRARVSIARDQIAEVDSKDHVILQSLDIVLGSMQFRLNDKHLLKPEGENCRGKRTIAKEKVYKHILRRIRNLHGYAFNIGVSTGDGNDKSRRWSDGYRHWLFKPQDAVVKPQFSKAAKRKGPAIAT